MQNWKKAGLIYKCDFKTALQHYAAVPFSKHLYDDVFRIYFSGRDLKNQSFVSYFDFDLIKRQLIADKLPLLLTAGVDGAFDDAGSVLFQIINHQKEDWLFYSGWTLAVKVPFRFNIGIAKATAGTENFTRAFTGPVVGQTIFDPYMAGAPYIIIDNGVWKMWYVSCISWTIENNVARHHYLIMYTESNDGVNWFQERRIAIDFKDDTEYAIARPMVIYEDNLYKMWYSYRGPFYKIGYAESADGVNWQRKDEEVKLDVSPGSWDSEMICYSFIFNHNEKRYMLYNGNCYGKSGIGLAVLESK